jgi:hypothetical protein
MSHSTEVKRGYIFTHDQVLDENWTPDDGQEYDDGPRALMVVTRATLHTVWYKPVGRRGRAACAMDRAEFESRFGRWARHDLAQARTPQRGLDRKRSSPRPLATILLRRG